MVRVHVGLADWSKRDLHDFDIGIAAKYKLSECQQRDREAAGRSYDSCKIFKGRPRRNAFSKLVHRQFKSFPDRFCQVEMKNPTRLSNKSSNA